MSALSIQRLSVQYHVGVEVLTALDGVDLEILESEFVVILGANGAGKSTLINTVAGVVPGSSSGRITLGGKDIGGMKAHRRARSGIVRVQQDVRSGTCESLTVEEHISLALTRSRLPSPWKRAPSRKSNAIAQDVLKRYGGGRIASKLKSPTRALSGGQRQLLALIMAIVSQPRLLLLDEHTSALDPVMAEIMMKETNDVIRDQQLTTIMITHNLRHALEYGDRVLIMGAGRVVDDVKGLEKLALTEASLIERLRSKTGELTDRQMAG